MKSLSRVIFRSTLLVLIAASATAAQTTHPAPAVEIMSFRIGTDSYPMLDSKPSTMSADNPDFPRPPNEVVARQNRRGGFGERTEETRSRGKLRSTIKVLNDAQWIKVTLKNTSAKPIKAIEWDFAFPRYEDGKLALRYDVANKVEIKAGGKKTLKQPLPPGATRCQVIIVSAEAGKDEQAKTFEAVCGPGVLDASNLKQETVIIKRIEYADGTVWQRP